ncbi:MAG TPA: phage holin family protein [Thermoanaerobaculia bacterium]|nr:phage holin family protein [Thermoanaerobaculia bacterium]
MKEWLDLLRHLGDAVLDLAAAEAAALAEDLRRGGRQAARALVLLAVAAVLAVVAWALFTLALVWGLAAAIGLWQAALLVGVVYAAVAMVCAAAARRRFRAIEPPLETVQRRLEEQRTWFRGRILEVPPQDAARADQERAGLAGD